MIKIAGVQQSQTCTVNTNTVEVIEVRIFTRLPSIADKERHTGFFIDTK